MSDFERIAARIWPGNIVRLLVLLKAHGHWQ